MGGFPGRPRPWYLGRVIQPGGQVGSEEHPEADCGGSNRQEWRVALTLLVMLLAGVVPAAQAQRASAARAQRATASISGQLVEKGTGAPVLGARITIVGTNIATTSDSAGHFAYDRLLPGLYVIQARAIGYTAAVWQLALAPDEALDRVFELAPVTYTLEPIDVEARPRARSRHFEEFQWRMSRGAGTFITRDQIVRRNARTVTDMLRIVRGVRTECSGTDCVIRMSGASRSCLPEYFLDGLPSSAYIAGGIPPLDIEGIELYRGAAETPAEFGGSNAGCGVIAIWTRSGP